MRYFISLFFVLIGLVSLSQEDGSNINPGQQVEVRTSEGDTFKGVLLSLDDQVIVLKIAVGEIRINRSKVLSITSLTTGISEFFPNPHPTRYFFAPSAIPIEKGKGYYQNVYVVLNFVNVGVGKNVSIGGGFEFISTIIGEPIVFLTPKVAFEVADDFHAGAGVFVGRVVDAGGFTLPYAVATYGDHETNVTLGGGLGFTRDNDVPFQAYNLSGMSRATQSISLMTENYLIIPDGEDPIYFGIFGMRIMGQENAFDFGVITSPEIWSTELPILPYVGYARAF